ncbi:dihydroorotate oxidase A [Marininema mesophilum]|uniref:Dihydroorotate dehydrogenase (quinone) n=1 Tax=Marininema mesophilum TaxID=1048340 RepID=A0A1H2TNM0_9BACL|nr:quinone-dependent dihydroorotate dehydrogenase [Marininema mesophilum]SDW45432.1 dihydroorotate oxidase A [Marininema mesophilum]
MVYPFVKNMLFKMDAEQAHEWTIKNLLRAQRIPGALSTLEGKMVVRDPRLTVKLGGLTFSNPVGLAAGFDKHAQVYPALAALGFGFVEVGTLTPQPQSGNPKPRLFRLPEDEGIINRMGFNNGGICEAANHFAELPRPAIPIGINLGKNKDTPQEDAASDYQKGLSKLYRQGDYFVINISSPNTPNLRDLQQASSLRGLLEAIMTERHQLREQTGEIRPIFLKLAPDLTKEQLKEIVLVATEQEIDGLIATNTTLSREGLKSSHHSETGGLSGRPLAQLSTEIIHDLRRISEARLPIIGVGGIFDGKDAYEKIRAGASLVQVYTGMIYRGPAIARDINKELIQYLDNDGLQSITEAVGLDD